MILFTSFTEQEPQGNQKAPARQVKLTVVWDFLAFFGPRGSPFSRVAQFVRVAINSSNLDFVLLFSVFLSLSYLSLLELYLA